MHLLPCESRRLAPQSEGACKATAALSITAPQLIADDCGCPHFIYTFAAGPQSDLFSPHPDLAADSQITSGTQKSAVQGHFEVDVMSSKVRSAPDAQHGSE